VPQTIAILDGSTFLVSDLTGDVDASPEEPHGFFYQDTRFLSKWTLMVDGSPLDALTTDHVAYFTAKFFLVPPGGAATDGRTVSIVRNRAVGEGFHEDLTVLNHGVEPVRLELRLEAGSDFADIFEVKDAKQKQGRLYRRVEDRVLVLGYQRENFARETRISSSQKCTIDEEGLTFQLELKPHSEWNTCVFVQPVVDRPIEIKYRHDDAEPRPNIGMSLDEFLEATPVLDTDWDPLDHIYRQSLIDLAALRFESSLFPGASMPAAGLPWFMTVFGRDSLITSFQALPFVPELTATTLRVLAALQATELDDFRDAEPGKILHEVRFGELTHFGERPHSPYYGTADATPLFVVLLDEYERWTGDTELVEELEPSARAALSWIDEHGDRDGDGFVEYQTRNPETGLVNQCWKDSWDSMRFADATIAEGPIAVCEIQGYVYDAKVRGARLARDVWGDGELAARLEQDAAALRRRFDEAYWMPGRAFFALALDGEKRHVDSITSNPGHLLWSGIVDEERARSIAGQFVGEPLFSGWGARTMASGEAGFSPIRYHNGTVWPHDNSLIAFGLARYGYRDEAAILAQATLEAAAHFRYRLPEVFAGYPRRKTGFPVEYPTASSPQAWAAAAPLLLIRALLGLEPGGATDPHLPDKIDHLELHTRATEEVR
jgi:glycogen debranching enzyme